MFQLKTAIPKSVDPKELGDFYEKFGIIPYYGGTGQTSHSFLDLLKTLTALSPSFNACMIDLNSYTFGRSLDIVGRSIPGLTSDTQELEFGQKEKFSDFLKELNISLMGLVKVLKRCLRYDKDCGNAYVHIKRVQVGDSVKYFIKAPHYKNCAYLDNEEDGFDSVIISPYLSSPDAEALMYKYPPTILRVTPLGDTIRWDQTSRGVEEAVIHITNEDHNDEGNTYGRPSIISSLTWLFTDYQVGNLNSKIAATEVITKKILAFEAPDPNTIDIDEEEETEEESFVNTAISGTVAKKKKKGDYFDRNMRVLRTITTNLGGHDEASTLAGIEYPFGAKKPISMDVEMNRDTKHHAWQADTASAVICSNLQWSAELVNFRQSKSGIGGNNLYDLFTIKNETAIQPLQTDMENIANTIISQICEKEGGDQEFKLYGLKLPDVIGKMLERFSNSNKANEAPTGEPNPANEDD